ncbi:MAG: hypothetical protein ACW9WZ_00075 [Nitrosopumilus sp.]
MNQKSKYLIPMFSVLFVLVFTLTPSVLADEEDEDYEHEYEQHDEYLHNEKSHHDEGEIHTSHGSSKMMGHHAVTVEGFSGEIALPLEMTSDTHMEIKNSLTVSLSDAVSIAESNGLTDAMNAHIVIVKDENGNKYLAWIISSMGMHDDSDSSAKFFVVDAGNSSNYVEISNPHMMHKEKMHDVKSKMEKHAEKMEKHAEKSNGKFSDFRKQFYDLIQQLRDAYKNGDSDAAQSIKEQLNELRQSIIDSKRSEL